MKTSVNQFPDLKRIDPDFFDINAEVNEMVAWLNSCRATVCHFPTGALAVKLSLSDCQDPENHHLFFFRNAEDEKIDASTKLDKAFADWVLPAYLHLKQIAASSIALQAYKEVLWQALNQLPKMPASHFQSSAVDISLIHGKPYQLNWRLNSNAAIAANQGVTRIAFNQSNIHDGVWFAQQADNRYAVSQVYVDQLDYGLYHLSLGNQTMSTVLNQIDSRFTKVVDPFEALAQHLGLNRQLLLPFMTWCIQSFRIDLPQMAIQLYGEASVRDDVLRVFNHLVPLASVGESVESSSIKSDILNTAFRHHLMLFESSVHDKLVLELLEGGDVNIQLHNKKKNPNMFVRRPVVLSLPENVESSETLKARTVSITVVPSSSYSSPLTLSESHLNALRLVLTETVVKSFDVVNNSNDAMDAFTELQQWVEKDVFQA